MTKVVAARRAPAAAGRRAGRGGAGARAAGRPPAGPRRAPAVAARAAAKTAGVEEGAEEAAERRARESARVEERTVSVTSAGEFDAQVREAGERLVVVEVESEEVCQWGTETEEQDNYWKQPKEVRTAWRFSCLALLHFLGGGGKTSGARPAGSSPPKTPPFARPRPRPAPRAAGRGAGALRRPSFGNLLAFLTSAKSFHPCSIRWLSAFTCESLSAMVALPRPYGPAPRPPARSGPEPKPPTPLPLPLAPASARLCRSGRGEAGWRRARELQRAAEAWPGTRFFFHALAAACFGRGNEEGRGPLLSLYYEFCVAT